MKLEACIEDLTAANRQLVRDRDDITHRHALARDRTNEVETENRTLEGELKRGAEAVKVILTHLLIKY